SSRPGGWGRRSPPARRPTRTVGPPSSRFVRRGFGEEGGLLVLAVGDRAVEALLHVRRAGEIERARQEREGLRAPHRYKRVLHKVELQQQRVQEESCGAEQTTPARPTVPV